MGIQRTLLALVALASITVSTGVIYLASTRGGAEDVPAATNPVATTPGATTPVATTPETKNSQAGQTSTPRTPAKTTSAAPGSAGRWETTLGLNEGTWVDVASRDGQIVAAGTLVNSDGTHTPILAKWFPKKAWVSAVVDGVGNATLTSIAIDHDGAVWVAGSEVVQPSDSSPDTLSVPILARFQNNSWDAELAPFPRDVDATITDIQVGPDGAVWVLGESDGHPTVMRRIADDNWQDLSSGLSGRVAGPIVVVGEQQAYVPLTDGRIAYLHGNKTTMAQVISDDGSVHLSNGVASGENDVWFVGHRTSGNLISPVVVRFNGSSWQQLTTPEVNGSFEGIAMSKGVPTMVGYTMTPGEEATKVPLVADYVGGRVQVSSEPEVDGPLSGVTFDGQRLWVVGTNQAGHATSAHRQ